MKSTVKETPLETIISRRDFLRAAARPVVALETGPRSAFLGRAKIETPTTWQQSCSRNQEP